MEYTRLNEVLNYVGYGILVGGLIAGYVVYRLQRDDKKNPANLPKEPDVSPEGNLEGKLGDENGNNSI